MSKTARGSFEVTISPADSDSDSHSDSASDVGIGRFDLAKTWSGDLSGTGHGQMLSAGDPDTGSAGYVALEIVDGTLHGRRGSFALQQLGMMRDGGQELRYAVVPGSGTGDLANIEGALALTIDDRGHVYELSYTLD
jgi:hypothetical protein